MSMDATTSGPSHTPLEEFLRAYAEVVGGVWDEVEPQVYDLMLPAAARRGRRRSCASSSIPRRFPSIPEPSSPAMELPWSTACWPTR